MIYLLVHQQFANLNMAIEIVDLPMTNDDFPVRYVNVYHRVSMRLGTKEPVRSLWDEHHWLCSEMDYQNTTRIPQTSSS